jgi:hypothetical protein
MTPRQSCTAEGRPSLLLTDTVNTGNGTISVLQKPLGMIVMLPSQVIQIYTRCRRLSGVNLDTNLLQSKRHTKSSTT